MKRLAPCAVLRDQSLILGVDSSSKFRKCHALANSMRWVSEAKRGLENMIILVLFVLFVNEKKFARRSWLSWDGIPSRESLRAVVLSTLLRKSIPAASSNGRKCWLMDTPCHLERHGKRDSWRLTYRINRFSCNCCYRRFHNFKTAFGTRNQK